MLKNKILLAKYLLEKVLYTKIYKNKQFKSKLNREIFDIERGNQLIYDMILSNKQLAIARIGSTERISIIEEEKYNLNISRNINQSIVNQLCNWSGFFQNSISGLIRFSELYKECLSELDIVALWETPLEEYIVKNYCSNSEFTLLRAVEPWYFDNPWTYALKGKKVLVIHPFKNTILSQIEKREKLFRNPKLFPECEINVIQAVQTISGEKDDRFTDWFEALEFMYQETKKYDFDIALIGCGAYGLPLASKIKKDDRIAIHMGGALQLLFGIKGNRWDHHQEISKLYNEYWVRPCEEEVPTESKVVENGCYW